MTTAKKFKVYPELVFLSFLHETVANKDKKLSYK